MVSTTPIVGVRNGMTVNAKEYQVKQDFVMCLQQAGYDFSANLINDSFIIAEADIYINQDSFDFTVLRVDLDKRMLILTEGPVTVTCAAKFWFGRYVKVSTFKET